MPSYGPVFFKGNLTLYLNLYVYIYIPLKGAL